MARAYTLNIAADTRAVKVGIDKGVIEPLEDALDVLEDIGRDGGRDLDKLEDAARDAQDSTEKVKKEFSDLAKEIRDTGRKAKTDFGDKIKDTSRGATEAVEEIGREAESTGKEMAASFDGSIESVGDAFQELTANAFAGFGPAGAVAGIAAAIGIGAVTAELQAQQERAEELKALLIDAYKSAAEEGRNFIDQATIDAQALEIFGDSARRKKAAEDAQKIGADYQTLVRALAGDVDALAFVQAQAVAKEEELNEIYNSTTGAFGDRQEALKDLGPVRALVGELETMAQTHRDGQTAAADYESFVSESSAREREQIEKTRTATQRRYEAAAEAAGKLARTPPILIPVSFQEPDAAAVRSALQRKINNLGPVRVDAEVYTRDGEPVF
jgi:archaellum component FlaC